MKRFVVLPFALLPLLATQVLAGNLTVNGTQTITSNLTAQSITLGGTTQSNWPTGFRAGVVLTNGVLNASLSQYYTITLTNNVVWTFQNHSMGQVFWLKVLQNSTGGWTNSWDPSVIWPGGISPQTTTMSNDWDLFQFVDDGTNWLGTAEGLNYTTNANHALQFDGNQNYLQAAYSAGFYPTNLTAECWFKTVGDTGEQEPLIGSFDGATSSYEIELDSRCSRCATFYFDVDSTLYQVSGGASLNDGSWHHVALVWNGSTLKGFVDGTSIGSTSTSGNISDGTNPFYFGRDLQGGGYFAPVVVDEVRISSIARYTASDPLATSFTVDSDTVAYWKLNEGAGTAAGDQTGNHNGTLEGSPPPAWVAGR
jgi:hypothetical protein